VAGSIARRPNGKWRARYRDETGHEHTRHFDRKVDAQLDQVTAAVVTGTYADPHTRPLKWATASQPTPGANLSHATPRPTASGRTAPDSCGLFADY
jgi:hypothetical protein